MFKPSTPLTLPMICDSKSKCYREDECSKPAFPCSSPKRKPVICSRVNEPVTVFGPVKCSEVKSNVNCNPVTLKNDGPVNCNPVTLATP